MPASHTHIIHERQAQGPFRFLGDMRFRVANYIKRTIAALHRLHGLLRGGGVPGRDGCNLYALGAGELSGDRPHSLKDPKVLSDFVRGCGAWDDPVRPRSFTSAGCELMV